MSEPFCDFCDLPANQCQHSVEPKPAPAPAPIDAPRIIAGHSSECPECGGRIQADVDEIVLVDGEWVHGNHRPAADDGPPEDASVMFGGFDF